MKNCDASGLFLKAQYRQNCNPNDPANTEIYDDRADFIKKVSIDENGNVPETGYAIVNGVNPNNFDTESIEKGFGYIDAIKEGIERKLVQEQESLEYEFRLVKAEQEAERQRIDAEGKAIANRILSASLTERILKEKGIEATLKLKGVI